VDRAAAGADRLLGHRERAVRLGDDFAVRLPRLREGGSVWSAGAFDRDREWLPKLAPLLPVAVPEPLAKSQPADGYPSEWAVYAWLPGAHPDPERLAEPESLARQLARFIRALRTVEAGGGPVSGRGSSLERWDEPTRAALRELEGSIDTAAALAAWKRALAAPPWNGAPVWVHGDLMPANLLVQGATLTGVLDWGGAGLGDPAIDLQPAWNLFSGRSREVFRDELEVDDASWERGRGWALWTGFVALPYYRETNPEFAENAAFRIGQVLGAE
jgi:aminoglycoside phosphotransferase (APT) family kinase protein